jgi:hypothetical protein
MEPSAIKVALIYKGTGYFFLSIINNLSTITALFAKYIYEPGYACYGTLACIHSGSYKTLFNKAEIKT